MSQWKPPELRPRQQLDTMLEYVRKNGYGDNQVYVRGLLAALTWVTGETDEPPITKTPLGHPVTGMDASSEKGRAYEALHATADPALWAVTQEKGTQYTLAVEHTLAWVNGSDDLWAPWEV
ncbi:hypothetical protein [Streptomyces jumonjinensis]|uniref:hypothetical protein n=1 Tax=Streptomyces jumonjinensis TaxID=1945 RepID=UPI0037AF59B1